MEINVDTFLCNSRSMKCAILLFPCLDNTEHCYYCAFFYYPTLILSLIVIIKLFGYSCKQHMIIFCHIFCIRIAGMEHTWSDHLFFIHDILNQRAVLINPLFRWSWYLWKSTRELVKRSRARFILNKGKYTAGR